MSEPILIRYQYAFPDGKTKTLEVRLDRDTLDMIPETVADPPEWTRLEFHRCPTCPLDPGRNERCPLAYAMLPVISAFSDALSYETVTVSVETENRIYRRENVALQRAISSLLGSITPTSGCPVLRLFRPMVDTHLPFATSDETIYRVLSMYLLGQYFRAKRGLEPDWKMTNLLKSLERIQAVNIAFCNRLRAIRIEDASINALVILNTFGDMTSFSLEENDLDRLESIFAGFYQDSAP